jgi:DNA-binding transcriptional MerR regulator
VQEPLVSTGEAARLLGLNPRTLARYVERGWIIPDLTLPTGQFRWDVEKLRQQINALPRDRSERGDSK